MTWKEKDFLSNEQYEERFLAFLNGRRFGNYEYLKNEQLKLKIIIEQKKEKNYQSLIEIRGRYIQKYPNRSLSTTIENNIPYEELLQSLSCED